MSEEKKAGYDFIIRFPPVYACELDDDGNLTCKSEDKLVIEDLGE